MKQVILSAALAITTAAQAQGTKPNSHPVQAYTTLGPAGAGGYVEPQQHTNPNAVRTNTYGTRGTAQLGVSLSDSSAAGGSLSSMRPIPLQMWTPWVRWDKMPGRFWIAVEKPRWV